MKKVNKFKLVKWKLLKITLPLFEFVSKSWFTYTLRPRRSADYGHFPDPTVNSKNSQVAIVLQGPVMTKWDFTVETIKMYKMMFPDVHLIVSTWCDTPSSVLDSLQALDIHIVCSEYPGNPGISHVNYQIVSTVAGIRKAGELGAKYCLKTRTDQRMYRHDAIQFLLSLLAVFPLSQEFVQLKGRLIAASLNTYKYRLYGISDMFLFGNIEDMEMYWDVPLDPRDFLPVMEDDLLSYSQQKLCEVYFFTLFMEKLNIKPDWTLRQSWQLFKDLFCVIDQSMLDLYWPKYNRFVERRRLNYQQRMGDELFCYSDWIRLYANVSSIDCAVSEKVLTSAMDTPF